MELQQNVKADLPVNTLKASQEIDYQKIAEIILSRWYWIIATLVIALASCWLYIWYTPKTYATSANVKFEDKRNELSNLVNIIGSERYTNKIESESWVFRSRNVIFNAIDQLDWKVSYYLAGKVRTTETYPRKPFPINILTQDTTYYGGLISFKRLDQQHYQLSYMVGNNQEEVKTYKFYQTVLLQGLSFKILPEKDLSTTVTYQFRFNNKEELYWRMISGLNIQEAAKYSTIAIVSKTDTNPWFATYALNAIIKEYLKEDLKNKTQSASQIIVFIDSQLDFLSQQVNKSGKALETYKQSTKLVNLSSSASMVLSNINELETEKSLQQIQLLAIDQLEAQIKKDKGNASLNFNLEGTIDPLLSGLITQLNTLIGEREKLLVTYKANSEQVIEVEKRIGQIKNAAIENIYASRTRINKIIKLTNDRVNAANSTLTNIPTQERELMNLSRDFEVNEKIYSYLFEKKLEAQIGKASVLSGASLIDAATINFSPISPNEASLWRIAWIAGIAIGIGLIFLVRMLNPFIYDKETVESLTNIPIIGVVRKYSSDLDENSSQILSIQQPKSIFAESVRSVRTNLSYLASEKESKVICITSEIAGEGKSFISINLASTMALIDKKVILIGADLRRSKLAKTFKMPNKIGLSSFLSQQAKVDEIIQKTGQENLDVIFAGPVPPNPSELLYSDRYDELIAELKKIYDVILVDTAPVGLVSDAIPIIRSSDINLFVIRSGVSKFSAASVPQRISNEYHLRNVVILLNAFTEEKLFSRYYSTNYSSGGYTGQYYYSDYSGYKAYGYYGEEKPRKPWEFWKWFKKS